MAHDACKRLTPGRLGALAFLGALLAAPLLRGDGKVFAPRSYQGAPYKGSLEERSQEALIIFHASDRDGGATEDLILKIEVAGKADAFAWVIPFPKEPAVEKEDARLFEELLAYVESRLFQQRPHDARSGVKPDGPKPGGRDDRPVDVLSRRVVGSYDVAVVRENEAGALNRWLVEEGYRPLPEG